MPFPLGNQQLITPRSHGGLLGMHIECMVVLCPETTSVSQLEWPQEAPAKRVSPGCPPTYDSLTAALMVTIGLSSLLSRLCLGWVPLNER